MEITVVLASKSAALQHMEYCAAAKVLPHSAVAEQQILLKCQQSQHPSCLMSAHACMIPSLQHTEQS